MGKSVSTRLTSRRTLRYALFGGIIHLSVAGFFCFYFNSVPQVDLILPYLVIGAVVLGVLPAILLETKRLVTPSLVVAGTLVASVYFERFSFVIQDYLLLLPRRPIGLPYKPFQLYLLGWVIVATVALIVGGGEYGFHRYR